jgi:hypothetical protein
MGGMQGEAERALRCRRPSLPSRPHFAADSIDSAIPRPGTGGLTVGYGILIRLGEFNLRLLSRECPRVHQVEAAGGLEAFLARYLKQIADFTTTRPTSRMPKRTN